MGGVEERADAHHRLSTGMPRMPLSVRGGRMLPVARRAVTFGRCAPTASALRTAVGGRSAASVRYRLASGSASGGQPGTDTTKDVATKPSAEPPATAAKASEPMDPAEFRRQQEAAGYVIGRKKRLRAPLSDYAPPGSSHALAAQGITDRGEALVAGRNASEKESDETHQRFESVLATVACITFAIWVIVSFKDIQGALTGEREPEIQTQIPGSEATQQARDARVASERAAVTKAYDAAKQKAAAREATSK
jgi:hypothetical protein